ncbi:hypothetical protein BDZ45DRAFT_740640 [Acephala macrosclerotiorum]|nr:hypothetical protein BDZ45DRAFT_740640 [Acephala macrosclerotiorum]
MQLRNRVIGPGGTFYAFKRLPLEIQDIIWRFSLQPRVVEVEYVELKGKRQYYSRAALPSAFYICHDSHNAVIPCYPRYFGSKQCSPTVLFNPSLDTLYLEHFFEEKLLDFFEDLGDRELVRLENIAISEIAGMGLGGLGAGIQALENWEKLGIWMKKLPALRNLLIVQEITTCLNWIAECCKEEELERAKVLEDFCNFCWYDGQQERCMEVYDHFPEELTRRFDFTVEEATYQSEHTSAILGRFTSSDGDDQEAEHDLPVDSGPISHQQWLEKRTRAVWGWRRGENPVIML